MSSTVTRTNMCMVYNGNRVLVENKVGKDYSGIAFSGGHVEPCEAPTNASIREVYEETGADRTVPG